MRLLIALAICMISAISYAHTITQNSNSVLVTSLNLKTEFNKEALLTNLEKVISTHFAVESLEQVNEVKHKEVKTEPTIAYKRDLYYLISFKDKKVGKALLTVNELYTSCSDVEKCNESIVFSIKGPINFYKKHFDFNQSVFGENLASISVAVLKQKENLQVSSNFANGSNHLTTWLTKMAMSKVDIKAENVLSFFRENLINLNESIIK